MLTKQDWDAMEKLLDKKISPIDKRLAAVEVRLTSIEKVVKRTSKRLDEAIRVFDHLDVNLRKKVKKIEEHLNFPVN